MLLSTVENGTVYPTDDPRLHDKAICLRFRLRSRGGRSLALRLRTGMQAPARGGTVGAGTENWRSPRSAKPLGR